MFILLNRQPHPDGLEHREDRLERRVALGGKRAVKRFAGTAAASPRIVNGAGESFVLHDAPVLAWHRMGLAV